MNNIKYDSEKGNMIKDSAILYTENLYSEGTPEVTFVMFKEVFDQLINRSEMVANERGWDFVGVSGINWTNVSIEVTREEGARGCYDTYTDTLNFPAEYLTISYEDCVNRENNLLKVEKERKEKEELVRKESERAQREVQELAVYNKLKEKFESKI